MLGRTSFGPGSGGESRLWWVFCTPRLERRLHRLRRLNHSRHWVREVVRIERVCGRKHRPRRSVWVLLKRRVQRRRREMAGSHLGFAVLAQPPGR